MRVNVTTNIVVTLVLSPKEAEWLHHYMQNRFVEEESQLDAEMRSKFFEATRPTT